MRTTAKEKSNQSETSARPSEPRTKKANHLSRNPQKTSPASEAVMLKEEISMLRSIMRRILTMAKEGEPVSELLKILDTVSKASTRLATLLKTQRQLESVQDLTAVLNQAIQEAMTEAGNG